jgi:hypothetical protein
MTTKTAGILILVLSITSFMSASDIKVTYQFSTAYERQRWNELSSQPEDINSLKALSEWCEEIRDLFISAGKSNELTRYLGIQAQLKTEKDLQAYLFFILSDIYWATGSRDVALLYMNMIPEGSYDIRYNYQPIGYYLSKRIISSNANAKTKIRMYIHLLDRYSDMIDIPYTLNELAQIYKSELDIQKTISSYQEIIRTAHLYPNINDSINLKEIKRELAFYKSRKRWIYKDLEVLINNIKYAIMKQDMKLLRRYVSDVDFFVQVSHKVHKKTWTLNQLQIYRRWNRRIVFSEKLEDYSNENEAYLKTSNWTFPNMKTWYFYFKRVEYPFDDRYDGGWEWKGIYFGERL